MLPAELIDKNRSLATPEGRQSAAAGLTLAAAALETAQKATKATIATQDAAVARTQAAQNRLADIQADLRTVRLHIGTEAIKAIDIADGRWTPSVSQAMAKPSARRQTLLAEQEAIGDALGVMGDHFTQDAPKLFAALLAEAESGLAWLHAAADLATIDILIATAPLLALDPNLSVISATGSVISAHCLAVSEQVVRVNEARERLRDAQLKVQGAN